MTPKVHTTHSYRALLADASSALYNSSCQHICIFDWAIGTGCRACVCALTDHVCTQGPSQKNAGFPQNYGVSVFCRARNQPVKIPPRARLIRGPLHARRVKSCVERAIIVWVQVASYWCLQRLFKNSQGNKLFIFCRIRSLFVRNRRVRLLAGISIVPAVATPQFFQHFRWPSMFLWPSASKAGCSC